MIKLFKYFARKADDRPIIDVRRDQAAFKLLKAIDRLFLTPDVTFVLDRDLYLFGDIRRQLLNQPESAQVPICTGVRRSPDMASAPDSPGSR